MSIVVFLAATALADDTVTLDRALYEAMLPPPEPAPEHGHAPAATWRDVQLTWVGDVLRIRVEWTLQAQDAGWFQGRIAGGHIRWESITWGGAEAAVEGRDDGGHIAGQVDRPVQVVLVGEVVGNPTERAVRLSLLPAVRGRLRVAAAGLDARLESPGGAPPVRAGGAFWSGADTFDLTLAEPITRARETLILANAGVGLTFGEGETRGRARVEWRIQQGAVDRVSLVAAGVGNDLDVTGPAVNSWRRSGDRVDVVLARREAAVVRLDLTWTTPLPSGDTATVPVPRIAPQQAWRTNTSLQLARDAQVEVVPELGGWEAIATADLPDWGEGLIDGTPAAAYQLGRAATAGSVGLLRFSPAQGPPTVVDVASYTLATTEDGRSLTRAYYTVRNERAAHLRVVPPPGSRIVGVSVAGEPALPVSDGDAWLVPLQRSVETVEGALSMPVELILLGDETPWRRREERDLRLPRLDAPVAVQRVTVHLPPGYHNRLDEGVGDTVLTFTEGDSIDYGFSVGDDRAAQADALFQDAVDAWMGNEFGAVEERLSELEELGADNENIARLRGNLHLIRGEGDGVGDANQAQARRVKEQARARALADERRQAELLREAERQFEQGDYSRAESMYEEALDLGKDLAKLEQDEEVEYKKRNEEASRKVAEAKQKNKEIAAKKADDSKRAGAGQSPMSGLLGGLGGDDAEDPVIAFGRDIPIEDQVDVLPDRFTTVTVPETVDGHASSGPAPSTPTPRPQPAPEVDATTSSATVVTESRSARVPLRLGGTKSAPKPPDEVAARPPPSAGGDAFEPLTVTATQVSVVVPTQGEAVRYQTLLLPADATPTVRISARSDRRHGPG